MQQEEHRPYTIQPDGSGMVEMSSVRELRPKVGDSEKITINLGYVDLGQVDLLVQEGFYSNRTDFIRTAIRNQLDRYNDAVKKSVARHQLDLGLRHYGRKDLEASRPRVRCSTSRCLALRASPTTCRPSWRCERSVPSAYLEPFTPAPH